MDFAQKLKCYRTMLNLSQNNIADFLGVDRSTYSGYETGKSLPTSEGIRILSYIFGISPAVLMNEKFTSSPIFEPGRLYDSVLEMKSKEEIDMSFPELSEDEKELIIRYRAMKATNSLMNNESKDEIDPYFSLEDY